MNRLSVSNLGKSIGGRTLLESISFDLGKGEIACLLGESGSGKSTLIKSVSLAPPPCKGEIIFENKNIKYHKGGPTVPSIYPELTAVFQHARLWPHLSVEENINLVVGHRSTTERFKEITSFLNIDTFMRKASSQISVGQAQRVMLARAILLEPKCILLDEITSAQDAMHIGRIVEILKELSTNGTSVLVATHLLGFAKAVSDKIIFLHGETICEMGGPQILMKPQTEPFKEYLKYNELLN